MFSQKVRLLGLPDPTNVFDAAKPHTPKIPFVLHSSVWDRAEKLYGMGIIGMQILFDEPLSDDESARLWTVVDYWSKMKFVTTTPVNTQPIDGGDWIVQVNTGTTASQDIKARDILRTLATYMLEGTPLRKTGEAVGTRAVPALDVAPCVIIVW